MTCLVFFHVLCYFFSAQKNSTFRAGRSTLPDYTLIVLKILKPLSAVLIITPGNCRCQWTSFTSFWPWNKTRKKWVTFKKKRKTLKNMSQRKNKWKNKRRISIGVTFSMSIHLTTPEFPSGSPTLVPWGFSAFVVDSTYICQSSNFCVFEDVPESQGRPFHWGIKCCLRLVIFAFLFLGFKNSSTFLLGSGHVHTTNFQPVEIRAFRCSVPTEPP